MVAAASTSVSMPVGTTQHEGPMVTPPATTTRTSNADAAALGEHATTEPTTATSTTTNIAELVVERLLRPMNGATIDVNAPDATHSTPFRAALAAAVRYDDDDDDDANRDNDGEFAKQRPRRPLEDLELLLTHGAELDDDDVVDAAIDDLVAAGDRCLPVLRRLLDHLRASASATTKDDDDAVACNWTRRRDAQGHTPVVRALLRGQLAVATALFEADPGAVAFVVNPMHEPTTMTTTIFDVVLTRRLQSRWTTTDVNANADADADASLATIAWLLERGLDDQDPRAIPVHCLAVLYADVPLFELLERLTGRDLVAADPSLVAYAYMGAAMFQPPGRPRQLLPVAQRRMVEGLVGLCPWEMHHRDRQAHHERDVMPRVRLIRMLLDRGAEVALLGIAGGPPLLWAAALGSWALAEPLVTCPRVDLDTRESQNPNHSALQLAAASGCLDLVTHLVDRGVTVVFEDMDPALTPLGVAATNGHLQVAKVLLGYERDHLYAWHNAVIAGHLELVKFFLAEAKVDVDVPAMDGATALMIAIMHEHRHVAEFLVRAGANVNVSIADGISCLHVAVDLGLGAEFVKLLLAHGANVHAATSEMALRPIHHVGGADAATLHVLLAHGADPRAKLAQNAHSVAHLVAKVGNTEVYDALCEMGLIEDVFNGPPTAAGVDPLLAFAAQGGHVSFMRHLLSKGADIDATTSRDCTALHWAVGSKQEDAVRVLLEHGANLDVFNADGMDAVQYAITLGHVEIVKLLCGYGADVYRVPPSGFSTVITATYSGNAELLEFLLQECNLAVDAPVSGIPALHLAARGTSVDVLKVLLAHGAEVDARNAQGLTPLHEAAYHGQIDCTRCLVEHGADPYATESHGMTPLDLSQLTDTITEERLGDLLDALGLK